MSTPPDIELGHLRDGYPALARWIARDPDHETYIFRKFDRLAARNILHLQAELTALEADVDRLDEEAQRSDDFETRQSSRRWETLIERAGTATLLEARRLGKLTEVKEKLREYHETLILQSQIAEMRAPRSRPLSTCREFLSGSAYDKVGGHSMPIISGRAKKYLEDEADLLTLTRPSEEDHLSRFLQDNWLFRKRETSDPIDRTTIAKNSHIFRTVAALDLLLAAILLIGAILNLYLVSDPTAKLGLVAMYTVLFASSVALCTNARRAEVFAATAAYAAVLVVFVSGDLGGTRTEQCLVQLEGGILKVVKCPS